MKKLNNVLLVNPGRYLYASPPLGLAYLSSYLKKNSNYINEVSLIDENAKEKIQPFIEQNKPRVVGISATTPQITRAHEIAKLCKSFDKKTICIIGGVHTTALPKQTLIDFPFFDIGVFGEGEETFKELVDNFYEKNFVLNKIDLAKIKGISFRQEKEILISRERDLIENLDSIPPPDRGLFNLKYYLKPRQVIRGIAGRATTMMSSRGCPYNCCFCSSSLMWQRKVRFHSPERFIEETEELMNFGFNGFYLQDDTFIIDKNRVYKICEMLIKNNYHQKLVWAAQLKVNSIQDKSDLEILRLMKRAGCVQVEYGFESGSQKTLSFLKKDSSTVEQNQKAICLTNQSDLRLFGNFMIGTQGETKKEVIKTKKFILKNQANLDYFQVYITTPYPGTELWNICEKEKLLKQVTWEKFGMGILDNFVFSNTVKASFIHKIIKELTRIAVNKISTKDKIKWFFIRLLDDPKYVFKTLKGFVAH